VPTLNKYANDSGYYIRAWTRELGNFNYKIKPDGWNLVEDIYDQTHSTEISWQEIGVLKSLGVIYTDESGVIRQDDDRFKPDPDQIDSERVSEATAKRLLKSIYTNFEIPFSELRELCSLLDLDEQILANLIESASTDVVQKINDEVESGQLPIPNHLTPQLGPDETPAIESEGGIPIEGIHVGSFVSPPESVNRDSPEWERGYDQFSLMIMLIGSRMPSGGAHFIWHHVCFDEEGVPYWDIIVNQDTWDIRAVLYRQVGHLLPTVIDFLSSIGVSASTSEDSLDITVQQVEAMMETRKTDI
jgi:hypothetical protein